MIAAARDSQKENGNRYMCRWSTNNHLQELSLVSKSAFLSSSVSDLEEDYFNKDPTKEQATIFLGNITVGIMWNVKIWQLSVVWRFA